jgi:CHAT domain-containing protein
MNKNLQNLTFIISLLIGINDGIIKAENSAIIHSQLDNNQLHLSQLTSAQSLYEQGDYEGAIAQLKTAISKAEKEGDILTQTQSIINLSLIYLKQSNWEKTELNINQAFQLITQINNSKEKDKLTNFALEIKGQLQLSTGEVENAFDTWEKSSNLAYERGDIQQFIYAEIKQIEALQELGMYGKAGEVLGNVTPKLDNAPQDLVTAKAWQTVGELLANLGKFNDSKIALNQGLNIAQQFQNYDLVSDIYLTQGNSSLQEYQDSILQAKNDIQEYENYLLTNKSELNPVQIRIAEEKIEKRKQEINDYIAQVQGFYQQSVSVTNNPSQQLIAELAQLNLLVSYQREQISPKLINNLVSKINSLPPDNTLINNQINLGANLIKLNFSQYQDLILEQLTQAYQKSEKFNYQRGKINALGNLAKLYQQSKKIREAKELTQQALAISQSINAPDLTYQLQWQLGRISQQLNHRQEAISAYSQAVNILKSLRSELVGINSDLEFSFRENVEPVYRELVDILLQPEATNSELAQARDAIESLQIAELDNYFRDACLDVKEVDLDRVVDSQTAVIYPIILPDRIEVIVSLGDKSLVRYGSKIEQNNIENDIAKLIDNFNEGSIHNLNVINNSLRNLYQYLILPIESQLSSQNIKNLVFVSDGVFKNVPMSALYDGQQYLIEKYSVAIAPSLKLIEPKSLSKKDNQALLAGLSEMNPENPRQFSDLPQVEPELNQIKDIVQNTITILNKDFTTNQFREAVTQSQYPIVHVATHGEFSSKLEDTYLLTWDREISINELSKILAQYRKQKEPIELLVLSACKTASGDKRAALGLAGVAVRAGARSTVASLWYVSDQSTQLLMSEFYRELENNPPSKAEALRRAQMKLIENKEFNNPYFWSAFILVGNWL